MSIAPFKGVPPLVPTVITAGTSSALTSATITPIIESVPPDRFTAANPSRAPASSSTAPIRNPLLLPDELLDEIRPAHGETFVLEDQIPLIDDAVDAAQHALMHEANVTELVSALKQGIAPSWDRAQKLNYLGQVGEMLQMLYPRYTKLSVQQALAVAHTLACICDRHTNHVTVNGLTDDTEYDVANLFKPFFDLALNLESRLLEENALTVEANAQIAEILYLQARKGRYYYALQDLGTGKAQGRIDLVASILYAREASARLFISGNEALAEKAERVSHRMLNAHGITNVHPVHWAFSEYASYITGQLQKLASVPQPSVFANCIEITYRELGLGLHGFAPDLLGLSHKCCEDFGLQLLARGYRDKAIQAAAYEQRLQQAMFNLKPPATETDE